MADYKKVIEHFPAVRPYANPNLVKRLGNVLFYRPNIQTPHMTTDNRGFRRTVLKGENVLVSRSSAYDELDAVFGSSHAFGVGAESDAETIPSLIGELTNRRVLSVTMPEATTTDVIHAASQVLNPRSLGKIYLFPGGTFARFCTTGLCSPIDGPPTAFEYPAAEYEQRLKRVDAEAMFDNLIRFQMKSIRQLQEFANRLEIELVVVSERTFFEKEALSPYEIDAKLGEPANESQQQKFSRHIEYATRYHAEAIAPLSGENIHVIEYPDVQTLEFIDEFHPTPASNAIIAEHVVAALTAKTAA